MKCWKNLPHWADLDHVAATVGFKQAASLNDYAVFLLG